MVEVVPYDPRFWERKFTGRPIFEEEDEDEGEGTVILDESMLMEEEPGGLQIKTEGEHEKEIVANMVMGWRDGEYSTGSIKAALDKFIRERHHVFMSDCRNFCFESYLREDRGKIENPNITNLMQKMSVHFCSKMLTYYSDMYRHLLTRCFSLVARGVTGMVEVSRIELSIEEKEKITLMVDGLFSILAFAFKVIYERVLELVELKVIYDSMELHDFKQLINVLETEEEFIEKHLSRFLEIGAKDTFLEQIVGTYIGKFDLGVVRRAKEEKVLSFLNRTHRYIIEN